MTGIHRSLIPSKVNICYMNIQQSTNVSTSCPSNTVNKYYLYMFVVLISDKITFFDSCLSCTGDDFLPRFPLAADICHVNIKGIRVHHLGEN